MPVKQADDVVERPDLRLKQQCPEIADDGGRQHHRQQDDRRPETVRAELPVDQQRQAEADDDLQRDRPDHETRGRLQAGPNVLVGQDVDCNCPGRQSASADTDMLRLRLVKDSRIIQINGKMLIASSSSDRRRDEQPGNAAIR